MVSLTKIYTRTGDSGQTSIGNGTRVSKLDRRIVAGGIVDELNSFVGMAIAELDGNAPQQGSLESVLTKLQQRLFDLGADLTSPWKPDEPHGSAPRMSERHIEELEALIDEYNAELGSLKSFVLPGGTKAAAALHVARSTCRKAELAILKLRQIESLNPQICIYINRLSDLLFVLARHANNKGAADVLWVPDSDE